MLGEIAGAKMSDIKGLEEVRETPLKRQEEGNADNGRDDTCRGPGLGGNLHLWLHFLVNLKLLLKNKVYLKEREREARRGICCVAERKCE